MFKDEKESGIVFILAVFSIILYFNSLWNGFVFDDLHTISENLYIKDSRYFPLFFKGYYSSIPNVPKGMFRPLLMLSFAFNYFFSGLQPLGYHIINILLHFLNAVLLYCLLKALKKQISFGLTLFLCLLFLSHPINTETVTYITCRSDLLVSFFLLGAFLSYLKAKFILALLLYILALLSKETALVFPFLILAYDFFFGKEGLIKERDYKDYAFYILIIAITLSYWIYRAIIFNQSPRDLILSPFRSHLRSFPSNIFTQVFVALFYLRLFIFTHPLNLHHVFNGLDSLISPKVFLSIVVLISIVIIIFILRKKSALFSFGLSWYLIGLLPKFYAVLNFPAMEHHFYLPGFGLYFVLAVLLERLYLRFRREFIFIGYSIILVFMVLVWFRNYEWKDALRFYQITVKREPNSAVAHNNLGIEYLRINLMESAEKEFKKALSLSNSIDVHVNCRMNLARIYSKQKRYEEAVGLLNEALRISPHYSKIYQSLGVVYINMGKEDEAEKTWKTALNFDPRASGVLNNLGLFYLKKKQLKEARDCFQRAIKSNPDDHMAYFGLGQVCEEENDIDSAIKAYEKSIKLYPGYYLSHYTLGTLYAKRKNKRSLWHLKETIRLAPDFAEGHNNLAILYASLEPSQMELARKHAQKALILGYKVDEEFLKLIDYYSE
ncbi:MAG: tetratricopeptide repeat protein [Candidatus Omnitrophica bacterium]|nr:tetratricopeptide repeat protein [Candidatus Omnitrophota bacterium]